MRQIITKRIVTLALFCALAVTTVFAGAAPVQAADAYTTLYVSSATETATAGTEVKYPITLTAGNDGIDVIFMAAAGADMKIALYDSTGALVELEDGNPVSILASNWSYSSYYGCYGYEDTIGGNFAAGDYTYGVTFTNNTSYQILIAQVNSAAKISQEKATVTVGFSQKLSVSNGTVKAWKSKDSKIAKVDSKGKVTGKKAGKTTVYAELEDGTQLTCKVTVKKNVYSDTKITTSDISYGDTALNVYKAEFDKKGNLVMKAKYVNNSFHKTSQLKNIKIVVKDANGKKVGVYKASKISVSVASGSTKNMTFTIKKSALKKKTCDLRNASITESGKSMYYY